jgi:hypothetical protein
MLLLESFVFFFIIFKGEREREIGERGEREERDRR